MKTCKYLASGLLLAFVLSIPSMASAGTEAAPPAPTTISINVEMQDFSRDFGSLRSARIEYKNVIDSTTVIVTPVVGRREAPAGSETSFGGNLEVYQNWTPGFSTRTALFVSEDKQVFARVDVAQDATFAIFKQTTGTLGVRWADYANGDKVLFISAGARRYFRGGSLAYRATYTLPNGRDVYLAHLANLTINDSAGRGKTQIWLSYGNSSVERGQFEGDFNGHDYGASIRRIQPLGPRVDAILLAGITSYDNPAGRVWGKTAGVGFAFNIGD